MSDDGVREYLTAAYASREDDARGMLDALDAGEEYDGQDASDALAEYPLDVNLELGAPGEVLLSTGGPSEWLEVECRSLEVSEVTFRAAWGSESVRRHVPEHSPLHRLASYYLEPLLEQER